MKFRNLVFCCASLVAVSTAAFADDATGAILGGALGGAAGAAIGHQVGGTNGAAIGAAVGGAAGATIGSKQGGSGSAQVRGRAQAEGYDDEHEHHDNGRHRGWNKKHHGHHDD